MTIGADQVRTRNRFGERNLCIRDGPLTFRGSHRFQKVALKPT